MTTAEETSSSQHTAPLSSIIHPSWAQALEPVEPHIRAMGELLRAEQAQGIRILPAGSLILRAFTYPLDSIKVLIVGQDPYPTPGHAVGLSFSVAPHVHPLPKSLINIFKELVDDMGVPEPSNGDLTAWADQGVMLLNRSLSVRAGQADSHEGLGWEVITEAAIRALNNRVDSHGNPLPFVAILWGRNARNLKPLLTHATVIESAHPSPLSAYRGFFGSHPFSRTNEALANMGVQPINWQLP
jgi:uracil-DNA glycosylase